MLSYIGGFVLLAALLHASWNSMLHGNDDRLLSMTWMSIAIAAVSTVVILFTPWPASAAWLYMVTSGVCGVDRTIVSAGGGQWKTLACVRDRRGWGGLFGPLTLRVCALLYRHYHVEDH